MTLGRHGLFLNNSMDDNVGLGFQIADHIEQQGRRRPRLGRGDARVHEAAVRRKVILASSACVFAIVATAAGMLAADRMQRDGAGVVERVGERDRAADWSLGCRGACGRCSSRGDWLPRIAAQVIFRCIGVGFALHVLILVALFVPRLGDRAAFSATVYLMYARLFCVTAIAMSTAWLLGWAASGCVRIRPCWSRSRRRCVAGSVALVIAVVRHTRADGGRWPRHRRGDCRRDRHGCAPARSTRAAQ